ncbi:coenzyme F420-reducing hydrogenase gamma subunit [Crossiella equi]|uniref:Coenzyme F420-reducing hydrogenase gamma subunit n=1 Tax=Crossiella equi TaxID=130796 RepID=A0ABS5A773_9PSEU|nr:oxidoreductase [Crossiella equi]MBP2472074.1 coenzyme F420-reducing hydrogenase gamma subunit [Crossiella equi]
MGTPRLAVWKFTSCDGCQLNLLDCTDELLALADLVYISHFTEASSVDEPGPYDISVVEGSISTPEEVTRIRRVREQSGVLVVLGACGTAGGIQALREFGDVAEFSSQVYASPSQVAALATSTPIAAHVPVDYELRGCPINRHQLLEVLDALLAGRRPDLPDTSVCTECKRAGHTCVLVAEGATCLGPVTQAGCGAVCPAYRRGCFGCFGPSRGANVPALLPLLRDRGVTDDALRRVFGTFNATAPEFRQVPDLVDGGCRCHTGDIDS